LANEEQGIEQRRGCKPSRSPTAFALHRSGEKGEAIDFWFE
jgi:hypothetical protein